MEGKSDVLAVAILERDRHQDVMVTWSFPGLDAALEPVLIARSGLVVASADEAKGGGGALFGASGTGPALAFRWSKFGTHWHYIKPSLNVGGGANARAVCIVSRQFAPEKFEALLECLSPLAHDPTKLLQAHLTAYTTGKCAGAPGRSTTSGSSAQSCESERRSMNDVMIELYTVPRLQ